MSGNRSFFSNFLAAFRTHSALQRAAAPPTSPLPGGTSGTQALGGYSDSKSTPTSENSNNSPRSGRPVTTKATQQPGSASTPSVVQVAGQFQSSRHHSVSPYSRSPEPQPSPTIALNSTASGKQRRGSDSSSEGYKEVLGAEKWYIGGRTAAGEERFYKLGMVRRPRSVDRLSLDKLSL